MISLKKLSRRGFWRYAKSATVKKAANRINHYVLARNMGTSVKMLEQFYGHTSNRAMASELTRSKVRRERRLPWEQ
jgi:hypothetical protein